MTTIDEWIAALESGRYPKGRGCLYRASTSTYCCLGVLADLDGELDREEGFVRDPDGQINEVSYMGIGEIREFLGWAPLGVLDAADDVAGELVLVNDKPENDTFKPVVAEIRRLYAEWKAAHDND